MAADGGDDEAEDERLDEADDEVTELEDVDGAGPELSGGNVEGELRRRGSHRRDRRKRRAR